MDGVEKLLSGQYCLQSTFKAQKDTVVSLKLPKFKLEKALDLIPTMESMGLVDIFHRGMADLSGNMDGVEKLLSGQYCLQSTFKAQKDTVVSLKLPKFKLEKALDLIPTMESMGLVDIFHRGMADLSGITKSERLHISLLKQSTVLKVDEAGVEAAAATGAVATPTSYQPPETKFHVTHSFVCMIYDEQLHVPLVAARVMQPAS
ncbi:hypothetical protein P879_01699 [Paragonimus westermani]|uniref:Serpin domain-containing protein n=1 Tax=Paragonimus westermani TaxID=34504 RepID=A0A8T0DXW4_9TREM|nr:hypothetical protein P879_01699 [Paragonimus westermani]